MKNHTYRMKMSVEIINLLKYEVKIENDTKCK